MKKKLFYLMMTSAMLVCGCNRQKECTYGETVYNEETEECDCIQRHNQDNFPYLSDNQYYNWEDLVARYEYYVKQYFEYPYYHDEGKTFKVCGWVRHYNDEVMMLSSDSMYAAFGISADSVAAFSSQNLYSALCHLEVQPSLLDSVDMDRKCYITGTLTFDIYTAFVSMSYYPRSCCCPEFALRVTEIHN
jgi:hypothetical protein